MFEFFKFLLGENELILTEIGFADYDFLELLFFVIFFAYFFDDFIILGFFIGTDAGIEGGGKELLELVFFYYLIGFLVQTE